MNIEDALNWKFLDDKMSLIKPNDGLIYPTMRQGAISYLHQNQQNTIYNRLSADTTVIYVWL